MSRTVVVCGSLAHPDLIVAAVRAEQTAGRTVLAWPVADASIPEAEHAAAWRRWIDRCDEVVVVRKPDGTLGASTRAELAYAVATGRRSRLVHPAVEVAR